MGRGPGRTSGARHSPPNGTSTSPQVRVTEGDARAALRAVTGKPVIPARARLRFGPGRTCEAIARLLDRAIVRAEAAGLDPRLLVVAEGRAEAGEDIVRVRRKAHGVADWIHSPTCQVHIVLRPAGLHASGQAAAPSRPARGSRWRQWSPPDLPGRQPPCVTRWPRSSTPTSA